MGSSEANGYQPTEREQSINPSLYERQPVATESEPVNSFAFFEPFLRSNDVEGLAYLLETDFPTFQRHFNQVVAADSPATRLELLNIFQLINATTEAYFYEDSWASPEETMFARSDDPIERDAIRKTAFDLTGVLADAADRLDNYYLYAIAETTVYRIGSIYYLFNENHPDRDRRVNEASYDLLSERELVTDRRITGGSFLDESDDLSTPYIAYWLTPRLIGRWKGNELYDVIESRLVGDLEDNAIRASKPTVPSPPIVQPDRYTWLPRDSEYAISPYTNNFDYDGQPVPGEPVSVLAPLLVRSPRGDRQAALAEFLACSNLILRGRVEADFNIELSRLDLPTQYHLIDFLMTNTRERALDIANYAKTYGPRFINSFLSLETGGRDMGDVLVAIAQRYQDTPEVAVPIFQKYSEIVAVTENVRQYLNDNFKRALTNQPDLENAIIDNLLKKGRDILLYAAHANSDIDIQQYLDGVKGETLLFSNAFRALKEAENQSGEPVNLEQFRDIEITSLNGEATPEPLKQSLLQLLTEGWRVRNDEAWPGQRQEGETVIADFTDLIHNPDRLARTHFYPVLLKGEPIAFFRLDTVDDGSLYLGSVNAKAGLSGAKIGEAMLDQIFTRVASGRLVHAECNPRSPISAKYISQFGFVATGLTEFVRPDDTFEITRDDRPESRQNAPTREFVGKSYEELAKLLTDPKSQLNAFLVSYTFPGDYTAFAAQAHLLFNQEPRAVITAFQQEKHSMHGDSYRVIVGFEPAVPAPVKNHYPDRDQGQLTASRAI